MMDNICENNDMDIFTDVLLDIDIEHYCHESDSIKNNDIFNYQNCLLCDMVMLRDEGVNEMCYVCINNDIFNYQNCLLCDMVMLRDDEVDEKSYACINNGMDILPIPMDNECNIIALPNVISNFDQGLHDFDWNAESCMSKKRARGIVNPIIEHGTRKILRSCIINRKGVCAR
jgi:hypothetical protein